MRTTLFIFFLALATPATAQSSGCVQLGNKSTDQRVWWLCPRGEVFEAEYRYYGNWSDPYPLRTQYAPCPWMEHVSAWLCTSARYACTTTACRKL